MSNNNMHMKLKIWRQNSEKDTNGKMVDYELNEVGPDMSFLEMMDMLNEKLAKEGRQVLALPSGHELKAVGFSPSEMQLIELQRFLLEQIARIYSLPPVFLQDLSNGTFSNNEQQDLHFVKHTLRRWIEQTEQEMNLKLFGRESSLEVRYNVDSLLRGDLKTRMEAHAAAIQNAVKTPNEVREIEGLAAKPSGDDLLIQGATIPIATQSVNFDG